MSKVDRTTFDGTPGLVGNHGVRVLERSNVPGIGFAFIPNGGGFVPKDQLEEVTDSTIIPNKDLPSVQASDSSYRGEFLVDGYGFYDTDTPEMLRETAYKYLAGANEIERRKSAKAEKEKAEKAEQAEKDAKLLAEVAKIEEALKYEGVAFARVVAKSLWKAGIRPND